MQKINLYAFFLGIILTAIAIFIGLPMLVLGSPDYQSVAIFLMGTLGPLGFLLWFTGFIGYTLIRPHSDIESDLKKSTHYQSQIPD